jgi:hypothetical protein
MTTYIVAVHLIVEVDATNPRADIAMQLDNLLTSAIRQNAGSPAALVDWTVAGSDLADSMAPVSLSANYQPDISDFPCWPGRQRMRA